MRQETAGLKYGYIVITTRPRFGGRHPSNLTIVAVKNMSLSSVRRVAVIGAGPAGAIAVDALAQEKTFDLIRVFERREGPGGCW